MVSRVTNDPPLPLIQYPTIPRLSPGYPIFGTHFQLANLACEAVIPDRVERHAVDLTAYALSTIRRASPPFLRSATLLLQHGRSPPPELQDERWSATHDFRHFLLAIDASLAEPGSEFAWMNWLARLEHRCETGRERPEVQHCLDHFILPVVLAFSATRDLSAGRSALVVSNFERATIVLARFLV